MHPTMLIGTSTRAGAFNEAIVTRDGRPRERPVIMPLSNPTTQAEAVPADLIGWTDGRALVATGSPFGPVDYEETHLPVGQANNALVFPGLGLGVAVARARRVTDGMLSAAADAVAGLSDANIRGAPLLPPVETLREVSAAVAVAVAEAAAADGLADVALDDPIQQIHQAMWQPEYPRVEAVTGPTCCRSGARDRGDHPLDPLEAPAQVLGGGGIREAQVALAVEADAVPGRQATPASARSRSASRAAARPRSATRGKA